MSLDPSHLSACVESLRRDGLVSEDFRGTAAANEWRAAMRRTCRTTDLRIRTFAVPARGGKDGEAGVTAYVHHIDQVVTAAELRAAAEAMGDLVSGGPQVPFAGRLRKARRETMRVVPADE
jgi:hypothetical protein